MFLHASSREKEIRIPGQRHHRADQRTLAGRRQPARIGRARRLQALHPAHHLPVLLLTALRAAPRRTGSPDQRAAERILQRLPRADRCRPSSAT